MIRTPCSPRDKLIANYAHSTIPHPQTTRHKFCLYGWKLFLPCRWWFYIPRSPTLLFVSISTKTWTMTQCQRWRRLLGFVPIGPPLWNGRTQPPKTPYVFFFFFGGGGYLTPETKRMFTFSRLRPFHSGKRFWQPHQTTRKTQGGRFYTETGVPSTLTSTLVRCPIPVQHQNTTKKSCWYYIWYMRQNNEKCSSNQNN